jgi:hypothetical protein
VGYGWSVIILNCQFKKKKRRKKERKKKVKIPRLDGMS